MGKVVVGGRLRSRLLVGVAALAMAAPASTRALAQSVDKWQPYLEAGGMVGINAHSFGDVDIFLPLWQDQTSLFFGDLRGTFTTSPSQEGNFGLGYRTQLNTDWILGGYGFIDIQNSKNNNLFYQGSLGAELLSVDWDFRLNGYLPFNGGGQTVSGGNGSGNLVIFGNNFGFQTNDTKKEFALYGFDGEVGWRVPIFPVDGDMDLRVFAGGYYFAHSDVDTIAGPRGRIEARLYDIDFLGLQSRLTAQGVIQWDQPRGTQGFGGLELRIPLGIVTGSTGPKLNPLDRRMVDRVQRDVDIVTETGKTNNGNLQVQEVRVDELTVTTHTAVFADGTGTDGANGTQQHPTDLNNAPSLGQHLGSNAVIIAQGDHGPLNVTNPVQLSNGQALIGGGSTVALTLIGGRHNGEIVNFSFPGSRPTVVGDNPGSNLIQMAPGGVGVSTQNRITGLDLTGSFSNGIFGRNVYRAVITGNSITGASGRGIFLKNESDGIPHSAFVDISRNDITHSTGDGIDLWTYVTDGAARTQSVTIAGNIITNGTNNGIFIFNGASSAGSAISQTALVNNNTVTGNALNGIYNENFGQSGGPSASR